MSSSTLISAALALAVVAAACGKSNDSRMLTSPSALTAAETASVPRGSRESRIADLDNAGWNYGLAINFPGREAAYDFRLQLEQKYRDELRRTPITSFVDIEGTIVWTQEYLRYRLNRCNHGDATTKVFQQIRGQGIQPTC